MSEPENDENNKENENYVLQIPETLANNKQKTKNANTQKRQKSQKNSKSINNNTINFPKNEKS